LSWTDENAKKVLSDLALCAVQFINFREASPLEVADRGGYDPSEEGDF